MIIEQIIANVATVAILGAGFAYMFRRWMDAIDAKLATVCTEIDKKVDKSICTERKVDEKADAREVWNWLKYHTHAPDGSVIVPKRA